MVNTMLLNIIQIKIKINLIIGLQNYKNNIKFNKL